MNKMIEDRIFSLRAQIKQIPLYGVTDFDLGQILQMKQELKFLRELREAGK